MQFGALTASGLAFSGLTAAGADHPIRQGMPIPESLRGRVFKSLKIGMVRVPGTLREQFQAVKEAGYEGIELDSPGLDVAETREAIAATGLVVDGTVCSTHWRIRHSDPDPGIRAQALADLQQALRETKEIGGHSVLLVPGHGRDGSEEEVRDRSVENIRQAIPLAAELGIYIAIENVWNHFLYDHDGPANQTAERLRDYADVFQSPWVGIHFDIGNHQKYGPPADWIRTLGQRIVKLDVKDWAVEGGWKPIGEGDVDWPEVRRALREIQFAGWAAAEVAGGDAGALAVISGQMDAVLDLD